MKRKIGVEIICFLVIVLFVYAGVSKLFEHTAFTDQMKQSPLLKTAAAPVAWIVPWIEIAAAGLLAIPRTRLIGLYAAVVLMFGFTVYVAAILSFSEQLPCSCGGILQTMNWREHLAFNLLYLALAVTGVMLVKPNALLVRAERSSLT